MSDTSGGGDAAAAAPQEQTEPPLSILHQYTKDLSFENPEAPGIFIEQGPAPEVNINVEIGVDPVRDRDHEVTLKVRAHAKTAEKTLFMAELVYGGLIRIGPVPDEHVTPLLHVEAPRQLFPFARNIISEVTRDGGFPALMIGHVDFVELFRRRIEAARPPGDGTATGNGESAPEAAS